jgi:hypothetical protein
MPVLLCTQWRCPGHRCLVWNNQWISLRRNVCPWENNA